MTVSAYISDFLSKYDGIKIDTDHVPDGADKYGLFKSPSRDIQEFTDGTYQITEYYQFLARQKTTSPSERKEADEWLEELTYWIDDFVFKYRFPEFDGNRTVMGLSITGCPYPMEAEDRGTLYQMNLSITYIREREVF